MGRGSRPTDRRRPASASTARTRRGAGFFPVQSASWPDTGVSLRPMFACTRIVARAPTKHCAPLSIAPRPALSIRVDVVELEAGGPERHRLRGRAEARHREAVAGPDGAEPRVPLSVLVHDAGERHHAEVLPVVEERVAGVRREPCDGDAALHCHRARQRAVVRRRAGCAVTRAECEHPAVLSAPAASTIAAIASARQRRATRRSCSCARSHSSSRNRSRGGGATRSSSSKLMPVPLAAARARR